MNVDIFLQQINALQGRLDRLYQKTNTAQPSKDLILPTALKELGTTSEELHVAAEELLQQTETLVSLQQQLEVERRRYQDLFEFMPDAYLVTNLQGKIQEANQVAATLLGVEQPQLQGKLLINFVPIERRSIFRAKLNRLHQYDRVQHFTISLEPRLGDSLEVALSVAPVYESLGQLIALRWILRDVTAIARAQLAQNSPEYDPRQDRPTYVYLKGDLIPLEPEHLWLVRHGLVKLSTMSELGEDVLVGLLGSSMPFGSSLTDLSTYQAIAVSEKVELVRISLSEIAASPKLAQALLPQISQRLRQTESLLAIAGKRRVQERLYHMLLFLRDTFGQKVGQGIRVSIRLTHQELADACCTTRVTVTRELGKLQKQGKIMFDSHNHIVILDPNLETYLAPSA